MKKINRFVIYALVVAVSASVFGGCSSNASTSTNDKVEISMLYNRGSGITVTKEDAIYKEIEKRTNVTLNLVSPPIAEYAQKVNILMAANDIPDIIRFTKLNDMRNYAMQGALMPLDDLLKNAPNITAMVSADVLKYTKLDDKPYAIPMTKTEGKNNMYVRKDWLDALGMKVPETLDEYTAVLRAFTNNDPDKNGNKDTVGFAAYEFSASSSLFSPFFGAFGVMPGCYYLDEKTNELMPYAIHPNAKRALQYLNMIYSEGLINADFLAIKRQQSEQLIESGKAGMSYGWWNFGVTRDKTLKQLNPDAELIPIAPPVGPDGFKGNMTGGAIGNNCYSITSLSKNPERAMEFLDYFFSLDGILLSSKGIEGVNWKWKDNKKTPSSFKEIDGMIDDFEVLEQYNGDFNLFEPQTSLSMAGVDNKSKTSIELAETQPVIKDYGQGITCDELVKYGASLNAYTEETFVKIIIGDLPVSYFDEYVSKWKNEGGSQIIAAMTKQYNEISK